MRYHRFEEVGSSVLLYGLLGVVLVFFYVPIFTLIAFSFTDGRFLSLPFPGLSLKWYAALFADPDFSRALTNSLIVSTVATVITTVFGTAAAIAWGRYAFRFKRAFQAASIMPLLFPQLLLGVVLLLWFSVLGNWLDFSPNLVTVILGHVVYITPFVIVIVSVQVYGFDDTLEDAARDAGASSWMVLREITLPILWPGIFSAAVFAFLLSWGNFYITYSLSGTARTLPTFVFAGIAIGSSPIYPALATLTFIPAMLLVAAADYLRRRGLKRARVEAATE